MTLWKRLVLIGAIAYPAFLVWTFPATVAHRLIGDKLTQFNLQGIEGTVWRGGASSASYQGIDLGRLHWKYKPLALLTGKLEYGFHQSVTALSSQGHIGTGIRGNLYLSDLKGRVDAKLLGPLANLHIADFTGALTFDMERMTLEEQRLTDAEGTLNWATAAIGQPVNVQLGDLAMAVYTEDANILLDVQENNGPFGIDGYTMFSPDGTLKLSVKLQPTPEAPQGVVSTLRSFGQQTDDGRILITYTGAY